MSLGESTVADSRCTGLTSVGGLCYVLPGTMDESDYGRQRSVMSGELRATLVSSKPRNTETQTLRWRQIHDLNDNRYNA